MKNEPPVIRWKSFENEPPPQKVGTRILVWCRAAESQAGIVEMMYMESRRIRKPGEHRKYYWGLVVEHPWQNACMGPEYWTETIEPPLTILVEEACTF